MGKYTGKYERKEKTKKNRDPFVQSFWGHIGISAIGCVIMCLLGWEDSSSGINPYSTEFCVGLVAIMLVGWIITAVGHAIRKKKAP